MWYTNKYSNIILYQKYLGISIKLGCTTRSLYASSGPKAEESRLTIRLYNVKCGLSERVEFQECKSTV